MTDPPPGHPQPVDEALVDDVADRVEALEDYLRLEVSGLDRVPDGGAVVASNHTGVLGLDALLLYLTLYDEADRPPYLAVHPSFFQLPGVRDLASRLGLFEADIAESTRLLEQGRHTLFFPEGEEGNFKPLWRYYQLQEFHSGFSRAALASGAPIVPALVVGGEDSNPALGQLRWFKRRLGVPVPAPLSLLPLPAKWRIEFLDPIPVDEWTDEDTVRRDLDEEIARDLRIHMQNELDRLVEERGNPFL